MPRSKKSKAVKRPFKSVLCVGSKRLQCKTLVEVLQSIPVGTRLEMLYRNFDAPRLFDRVKWQHCSYWKGTVVGYSVYGKHSGKHHIRFDDEQGKIHKMDLFEPKYALKSPEGDKLVRFLDGFEWACPYV